MKPRSLLLVASVLLLLIMVGSAQAQSVFIIQPSEEATQSVQVTDGCKSFAGNLTVIDGMVDFYITDPSGTTILQYENVSYTDFSVNTTLNGIYLIHLANRISVGNVTASLYYGRNFSFAESVTISLMATAGMTASKLPPSTLIPHVIVDISVSVAREIFIGVLSALFVTLLLGFISKRIQKWKDGSPSKTPSTIKP